jgi:hypothetical protein
MSLKRPCSTSRLPLGGRSPFRRPIDTCADLQQYASGLVCFTGCDEGPLASVLARGDEEAGRETVERLVRIFGRQNV